VCGGRKVGKAGVYCRWEKWLVFNAFLNLKPVEWFDDRWYVMRLESTRDSTTNESILEKLEAVDLGLVEIVVEIITVVKFMDYGSGNGGRGSFEVDKRTDAA
jgi:hypothetical protein